MFGQDFDVKVWSKDFEFWNLIKICVRTCFFGKQNSTLGSVVPLVMFLSEDPRDSATKALQEISRIDLNSKAVEENANSEPAMDLNAGEENFEKIHI